MSTITHGTRLSTTEGTRYTRTTRTLRALGFAGAGRTVGLGRACERLHVVQRHSFLR